MITFDFLTGVAIGVILFQSVLTDATLHRRVLVLLGVPCRGSATVEPIMSAFLIILKFIPPNQPTTECVEHACSSRRLRLALAWQSVAIMDRVLRLMC